MKYSETRISKFLSGKGFYLVLAGCLVAIGVAAWSAWASFSPDVAQNGDNSSDASSLENIITDPVDTEKEDEPYESSAPSVESESYEAPEPIVADNFVYPLSGAVLKAFSDDELTYSKTFGDLRLHAGLDLECEPGSAVYACGNGVVIAIVDDAMLGKYVEIDHGNGIVARYCGLSDKLSVKEGNIVSAGTKLALIGDIPCECEDGTHLHLEFYMDGTPVDPEAVIEG